MAQETKNTSETVAPETEILLDSLHNSVDDVNQKMADLSRETERLLKSASKEDPIIKNLEATYLELLTAREQLQITIAKLRQDPEEN